jgi:hypothetical protein
MAKRVYFAFDYEDVADFRANVVRKHNFTGGVEKAGYFDASIWEEAKKKDPAALRRLINAELENTSVTVLLIGDRTWVRRWVRYEMFKSIERGNHLVGIHINSINGKDGLNKELGANPLYNACLEVAQDGRRGTPVEWNGEKWIYNSDIGTFSIGEQPIDNRGKCVRLSSWYHTYDWVADNGFKNFGSWIG